MYNLWAITSGKGGVGKSTVAASLAVAEEQKGKSVLIIDMDEGLRCLDLIFGVSDRVLFDLADVIAGKNLSAAVYRPDAFPLIYLVPAPAEKGAQIEKYKFSAFIDEQCRKFDTVILDFPAGMDFYLYEALPKYTQFITVCNPDPVSIRDAAAVAKKLRTLSINRVKLVINKFNLKYLRKGVFDNIDSIIDKSTLMLLGVVPYDEKIPVLQAKSQIKTKGRTARSFMRISKRLNGETEFLPKVKKI